MKRIVSALFALAVLAALAIVTTTSKRTVRPVYAQSGCSLATLTGKYAFVYTGFGTPGSAPPKPPIPDKAPVAAVGVLTFDGAGNLPLVYTISINGVVSSASDTGTYTINSDCTGSLTDETISTHFNLVILGGGAEAFDVETDGGLTFTFDAKKQ